MSISDTTPKARDVYFARLREMTPSERTRIVADLFETANSLQRAALRREFPGLSETEIRYRIAVTRFGRELADKAYGKS